MTTSSSNGKQSSSKRGKLLLMGFACVVMGIGFTFYVQGDTTFQCDRAEDKCTLAETSIIGGDSAEISVEDLHGATVVQTAGNRPGYDTTPKYRAFVEAEQGRASLSHAATSNESHHQALADKVNAFIDDPGQQRLETFDDGGQIFQYGPIFLAVFGVFLLITGIVRG